jgi:hypothetical protein
MDMSNFSKDSRLFHINSMKKPGNMGIVQETWTRTGWTSMHSVHGQHNGWKITEKLDLEFFNTLTLT